MRESEQIKYILRKSKLVPKQEYITAVSELNKASQSSEQDFVNAFNTHGNVFDIDEELKKGKVFSGFSKKLAAGIKKQSANC